jgi:hypothetical protein
MQRSLTIAAAAADATIKPTAEPTQQQQQTMQPLQADAAEANAANDASTKKQIQLNQTQQQRGGRNKSRCSGSKCHSSSSI